MRIRSWKALFLFVAFALVIGLTALPMHVAFAQGGEPSADDTPTPTPTPSSTPTATPTATTTSTGTPTNTPTNTPETIPPEPPRPTPPPPQPIPEPVTTILFGTGLAALSGVIAARRRKG